MAIKIIHYYSLAYLTQSLIIMKFRHIVALAGMIFPAMMAHAQYVEEALRYSQTTTFGSARFQSMGGVNTALGADISSAAGNPAGLGFFRKSEWSLTPSLGFANTRADYRPLPSGNITSSRDSKSNFNIANMGIVFASPKADIEGGIWRGGSFGISFTRLNNFHNQITFRGVNNNTSFTDFLADQAYDYTRNQLYVPEKEIGLNASEDLARAQLAYIGFLIDPILDQNNNPTNRYESGAGKEKLITSQEGTITTNGGQNQWNFSYGGNIADKFYFGAALGLSSLRYGYEKTFSETVLETDYPGLLNFRFTDNYEVSGGGVNGTVGAIFKPNDIIRFGISATTPTYYWNLREEFSSSMNANFDVNATNGTTPSQINLKTVNNSANFELTTPFRLAGGVAFFAGKHGFVSADVEYVAYNNAKLFSTEDDFGPDNELIRTRYQPTVNARIGGEFREGIFRARIGGAYFGDPYDQKQADGLDRTRINLSTGVGLRLPKFYIDFGVVHSRYKSGYTPYSFQFDPNSRFRGEEPSAMIRNASTNAVLSFGTFF